MCLHAGDALPVWGLMIIMVLLDGSGRRGLKVLYDAETGKFMVRSAVLCHHSPNLPHVHSRRRKRYLKRGISWYCEFTPCNCSCTFNQSNARGGHESVHAQQQCTIELARLCCM